MLCRWPAWPGPGLPRPTRSRIPHQPGDYFFLSPPLAGAAGAAPLAGAAAAPGAAPFAGAAPAAGAAAPGAAPGAPGAAPGAPGAAAAAPSAVTSVGAATTVSITTVGGATEAMVKSRSVMTGRRPWGSLTMLMCTESPMSSSATSTVMDCGMLPAEQ